MFECIFQSALDVFRSAQQAEVSERVNESVFDFKLIVECCPENDAALSQNLFGNERKETAGRTLLPHLGIFVVASENLWTLQIFGLIEDRANLFATSAVAACIGVHVGIEKTFVVCFHGYALYRTGKLTCGATATHGFLGKSKHARIVPVLRIKVIYVTLCFCIKAHASTPFCVSSVLSFLKFGIAFFGNTKPQTLDF